jgi:hypothetical protein
MNHTAITIAAVMMGMTMRATIDRLNRRRRRSGTNGAVM